MRPGKPGVATLARLLDERDGPAGLSGSDLERALIAALAAGGLPVPEQQVALPGTGASRASSTPPTPTAG